MTLSQFSICNGANNFVYFCECYNLFGVSHKRQYGLIMAGEETVAGIGWRRRVLLVEGCRSPELLKPWRHTRILEAFCGRHGLKIESFHYGKPSLPVSSSVNNNVTPFASPLLGPGMPGSPLLYSPDLGLKSFANDGMPPPLSLNDHGLLKGPHSPPWSPPLGPRLLASPVAALQEKLQGSPQVGVVHLALHSDITGMILRWVLFLPLSLIAFVMHKRRKLTSMLLPA